MEKETLSKEDMARICAPVTKRPSLAPYNGFGKRTPSDQPPVLTPSERNGSPHGHASTKPLGDVRAPPQRGAGAPARRWAGRGAPREIRPRRGMRLTSVSEEVACPRSACLVGWIRSGRPR